MNGDSGKVDPDRQELRALYDIRVKEIHHYNTVIWAFPSAYGALLAAEYRWIEIGTVALLCAALFNLALCYVFYRHVQNKASIQAALKSTEKRIGNLYGSEFVPSFKDCGPKATTVMILAVTAVGLLFLVRALIPLLTCKCPHAL